MLKLFKQGIALQLVVILLTMALLWADAFVHPAPMALPSQYSPLFDLLFGWMQPYPILASSAALLLVIGEGMLLNEMLYRKGMVSQNTLLPMMIYVLLMSQGDHTLSPVVVVDLLVLLSLRRLLQSGRPNITVSDLADTALLVGLASLVYLPATALLVSLLIMMPVYKMYRWNDWMALLLGLAAPYIAWATACFMTGSLAEQASQLAASFMNLSLDYTGSSLEYATAAMMVSLCAIFLIGGLTQPVPHPTWYKNNVLAIELPLVAGVVVLPFDTMVPLPTGWFAIGLTFAAYSLLWGAKKKMWAYELLFAALCIVTILTIL